MRRLLLLASAMVFLDLTFFTAIAPLLPEYVDDLHMSTAQAGILSAAYAAGTLAAALPGGYVASRFGPRRTVIVGLCGARLRQPRSSASSTRPGRSTRRASSRASPAR